MTTKHNFKQSYNKGQVGENIITDFFHRKGYTITRASLDEEKYYGYDFKIHKNDAEYFIEVKTEYKAESTGNIFWEMEVNGKPGWTQKYKENHLPIKIFILLPVQRKIYVFSIKSLDRITTFVEDNYISTKKIILNIENEGTKNERHYEAWGYLLPIHELVKFAKVYKI